MKKMIQKILKTCLSENFLGFKFSNKGLILEKYVKNKEKEKCFILMEIPLNQKKYETEKTVYIESKIMKKVLKTIVEDEFKILPSDDGEKLVISSDKTAKYPWEFRLNNYIPNWEIKKLDKFFKQDWIKINIDKDWIKNLSKCLETCKGEKFKHSPCSEIPVMIDDNYIIGQNKNNVVYFKNNSYEKRFKDSPLPILFYSHKFLKSFIPLLSDGDRLVMFEDDITIYHGDDLKAQLYVELDNNIHGGYYSRDNDGIWHRTYYYWTLPFIREEEKKKGLVSEQPSEQPSEQQQPKKEEEQKMEDWKKENGFKFRFNDETKRIQIKLDKRDKAIHEYLIRESFAYRPRIDGGVYQYGITQKGREKFEMFRQKMKEGTIPANVPKQSPPIEIPETDDPITFCQNINKMDIKQADSSLIQTILTILTLLLSMVTNRPIESKAIKSTMKKLSKTEKKQAV